MVKLLAAMGVGFYFLTLATLNIKYERKLKKLFDRANPKEQKNDLEAVNKILEEINNESNEFVFLAKRVLKTSIKSQPLTLINGSIGHYTSPRIKGQMWIQKQSPFALIEKDHKPWANENKDIFKPIADFNTISVYTVNINKV